MNIPKILRNPRFGIPVGVLIFPLLWIIASLYLANQAEKLIFLPERSYNIVPSIAYQQEFFKTDSGEDIDVWYFPKQNTDKAILFLHGNSGRPPHFFPDLIEYASVYAPSYPRFGLSSNKDLSPESIFETAEKALTQLKDKGYQAQNITIVGHSFGGAVATQLASNHSDLERLVLINTFSSIYSMCVRNYAIFCEFGRSIYPSSTLAQDITIPTDVYHYRDDTTIPFEEGQKLFEAIGSTDKTFTELSGYSHAAIPFDEIFDE